MPAERVGPPDDPLERAIAGALRDAIKAHGPITPAWIGSAVKRIVGSLRNAKVEAHARALGQRRWDGVPAAEAKADRSKGGKNAWEGTTPEERVAEMRRRRLLGVKRRQRDPPD